MNTIGKFRAGKKKGKHKKVAEFIENTKGKMVSTYSATAALIWLESGLWVIVFLKRFIQKEKVRK